MVTMVGSMSAPALATTIYDTMPAWDGSSFAAPFGNPDTATYGQTFVAPSTDTILQDFTFQLHGAATIQLQAQIYAWTGNLLGGNPTQGATGAALFTSAPITVGNTGQGFLPVTITTGGTPLTAGADYIALFTISGPDPTDFTNSTVNQGDGFGILPGQHVAGDGGGGFNFFNNGNDFSIINNGNWPAALPDQGDLAWTAHFTSGVAVVPEPRTLALLGTGLLGLAMTRRRKLGRTSSPLA